MDWDKLKAFHVVAESGSFTRAGETLKLSQSAVSRQIRSLEDSLGVPLFHRHARGLRLTEQGELLNHTARDVFAKLSTAETILNESAGRPKGPLRVTTTVGFGSIWLASHMSEFLDMYPEISVSVLVTDVDLDLTMGEADIAIRVVPPTQPDLIQRHLFTGHFGVYAVPSYLNRFGTPHAVEDLLKHRVVSFGEQLPSPFPDVNWLIDAVRTVEPEFLPALSVNNVYGMFQAVQTGVGLAALPAFMADDHSRLVKILPDLASPTNDAYLVYPAELRSTQRIAVFRDFLLRKVAETRF